MSDRNDWHAATDELRARERERLGDPPTPEEVVALSRGELSDAEAARVRALLVVYPDLTDVLTGREPENGAAILSDDDVATDWASLQRRLPTRDAVPAALVVPIRRRSPVTRLLAIAAVLALAVVAALLLRDSESRWFPWLGGHPRTVGVRYELMPIESQRGAEPGQPYPLPPAQESYRLVPLLYQKPFRTPYRLEVVNAHEAEPQTVWSGRVSLQNDGTLEVSVPGSKLDRGVTYRLDLYRDDTGDPQPVASYLVRVRGR